MTSPILAILLSATLSAEVQPGGCGDRKEPGFRLAAVWFTDHSNESWSIRIDSRRRARLVTADGERRFVVPRTTMSALREVAAKQEFWSLPSAFGEPSLTGFQLLELCDGDRSKTVMLHALRSFDSLTQEERRFLTVWVATRRLFVSKTAADVEYAEALLKR